MARSYLPSIRREDGMLVGRDRFRSHKWRVRHKIRDWLAYLVCQVAGHDWGDWTCDDLDGPGEQMEGGGFMPYLLRKALRGEWGMRHCKRCRLAESRWPEADAPLLWREKVGAP